MYSFGRLTAGQEKGSEGQKLRGDTPNDPFGADDPLADFGGTVHSGPFQHDPLVSDPFASDGLTTDQDPFGSK